MSHHHVLPYRELDQRTADGLTVTLEWNPATAALSVVVVDRESAAVTFPVRAEDASEAFVHPFVYAERAVYEAAGEAWRLRARARAADALAARPSAIAARAHHVERSARVGEKGKVLPAK